MEALSRRQADTVRQGSQLCPSDFLSEEVIARCKAWEIEAETNFTCTNDDYLKAFTPGVYSGVVAKYFSFNTDQATPHFRTRAELFEGCTGGKIVFSDAHDIAVDPILDIGSKNKPGAELHDAYLMIYSFTSEASSLGLLETLNDRISASNTLLKYEDMYPKVRSMGEYRKDGKTNIDLLMADGDFFVPVVRIDLLERDGKPLPHTWEELVELAKFYNGTDLNDDGVEDYGFCMYPRTGSGFNDAWIPELMYSTWATTDQTRGIQEGFFFDERTFEPRIGKGFENAMNIWKDLWGNSADGCITPNFVAGRCAIGLAPPGCHKSIFVGSKEGGVAWRNYTDGSVLNDSNGTKLWEPKMKDGSYAEPYRLKPFGSLNVVNRKTGEFEVCAPDTCPKGEKIPPNSDLPPDDRARILVESPHVNKYINRVPFYWSGGYGTGIRKSAKSEAKDLMWDFFAYVNTPITSIGDVVQPSWLDEWRYSQMNDEGKHNYISAGYSEIAWTEHTKLMNWGLGNDVNSALTLRLPGVLTYTRDVMLPKFANYMDGLISMDNMQASVRQGWEDATTSMGKISQVQIYRASLGLNGLSEFDLCQLHRQEMDKQDNTVCVKYDPQKASSSTSTIVAILVTVCFVLASITSLWMYKERKRRQSDAIWIIDKAELKFEDPPEIAGRGTFGLVVKAEYRGTIVAVKRVIPPKDNLYPEVMESGELKAGEFKKGASHINRKKSMESIFDDKEKLFDETLPDLEVGQADKSHGLVRRPSNALSTMSVDTVTTINTGMMSGGGGSQLRNGIGDRQSLAKWKGFFGFTAATKTYEQLKQEFIIEMRTLSKLRHPCITTVRMLLLYFPLLGHLKSTLFYTFLLFMHPTLKQVMGSVIDQKDVPMLVMEFMEYGSLYDLLHNETIMLDGELIFPILQDIVSGARFLHAANPKIIHGDLKAANVLVDGRFRAKISDFGLSAKKKVSGATGTPYWMAPELLRNESGNTAESDVYSFGIILFELYSRQDPYEGEDPTVVLDMIVDKIMMKRPPVPEGCPARISEIMKECVYDSPEKRPTFEEIDLSVKRLDSVIVEPKSNIVVRRVPKKRYLNEEDLIHQVFPKHVAKALLEGRKIEPDRVELATMFFSDIVGFTTISSKISPEQVSDLLDRLYLKFDELSLKHDVFKIETIGDAYVCVCNLVKDHAIDHAKRVAEFAIDTLKAAAETPILCDDPSMGAVRIRVGIHCGPLVARVVGSRNPRYCVFGDTVNTAARMESNSSPMMIHCSDRAAQVLKQQFPGLLLISRGMIPIKGKGEMETFFFKHDKHIKNLESPSAGSVIAPEVATPLQN